MTAKRRPRPGTLLTAGAVVSLTVGIYIEFKNISHFWNQAGLIFTIAGLLIGCIVIFRLPATPEDE